MVSHVRYVPFNAMTCLTRATRADSWTAGKRLLYHLRPTDHSPPGFNRWFATIPRRRPTPGRDSICQVFWYHVDTRLEWFFLPGDYDVCLHKHCELVSFITTRYGMLTKYSHAQRMPSRESHGSADEDLAGTETDSDKNAMLYYHRIGTKQGRHPH